MPHNTPPPAHGTAHPLLHRVLSSDGSLPFALLRRHGGTEVEVLTGDVIDADRLAEIPLGGAPVLAVVPFRQARERGFTVHDDGAPLRCLIVRAAERVPLPDALAVLPPDPVPAEPLGFDVSDEEYAQVVRRVIDDEIGRGAGANFVVMRRFEAHTTAAPVPTLTSWFRALLTHEVGSYWTFAVHAPAPAGSADGSALSLAGATPERHLSIDDGFARMNPISGTYRHPATGPTREGILEFLADTKENEELFMVVDEEMKMMSAVCPDGGRIVGPYLKQMARLSHTEYLLEGHTGLDPREALRLTMFAPTVTGSPMENACAVITRHETRPRGYYSGFLAYFTPTTHQSAASPEPRPGGRADPVHPALHGTPSDSGGEPATARYSLDAPILIRAAYLDGEGRISVPAGATLVRHSLPEHEVAETHAKASGVLSSLGLLPRGAAPDTVVDLNAQPGVADALRERNQQLAEFWVRPQAPSTPHKDRAATHPGHDAVTQGDTAEPGDAATPGSATTPDAASTAGTATAPGIPVASGTARIPGAATGTPTGAGRSVLVIDHEDQFTTMLAHQLHHLGLDARVVRWDAVDDVLTDDLVVFGPGPGDPRELGDPRIAALAERLLDRVSAGGPALAVCLSHQVLAHLAGFPVEPLPSGPRQGVRLTSEVFGRTAAVGYYNTFGARVTTVDAHTADNPVARLALEPTFDANGVLTSLRGPRVASVQGHLESVLSSDGYAVLRDLTAHVLTGSPTPTAR